MSRLFTQSALRTTIRHIARQPNSSRSFSILPALRPTTTTPTTSQTSSIFAKRPTTLLLPTPAFAPSTAAPSTAATADAATADLVPKTAISAHPSFAQASNQIRCGPRRWRNMNRPSRLVRQRRHGFLSRLRTREGRNTLMRRRVKGKKKLSA